MRSASVFRPRSARKLSNGPEIAPTAFCRKRSRSASSLSSPTTADAADHVGVAVQVLRRRVHDDVEAELERPLDVGAGEGVVGDRDQRRARLASAAIAFEVDELQQRIGRRLDPDHPRLRPDRRLDRVEVGEVDEGRPAGPAERLRTRSNRRNVPP